MQTASAAVRNGAARLTVSCTAPTACRGALVIERPAAGGTTPKTASRQRRVIYGRAPIAIPANRKRTVRVTLSRHARKALRGKRSIRAVASVRLGAETVAIRAVTLEAQRTRTARR